jgi:hypothetical protein
MPIIGFHMLRGRFRFRNVSSPTLFIRDICSISEVSSDGEKIELHAFITHMDRVCQVSSMQFDLTYGNLL